MLDMVELTSERNIKLAFSFFLIVSIRRVGMSQYFPDLTRKAVRSMWLFVRFLSEKRHFY